MNPYNRLSPFKWFVIQNFPFIEADFDAITEYQLLCKVVEYLNKTIDKTNELGVKVEELNNWFINLDVQDEIDNKLNEMVEDGTMAEIINEQIFNQLSSQVTQNANAITELQRHKYLLVGDSYLQGWTPDGTFTSWGDYFETKTGYNCDITAYGGACFSNYSNSFYSLINNVQTTNYTDVIIMGGYNDISGSFENIVSGIADCVTLCKTKFTSLKNVYIGMVGNSLDYEKTNPLVNVLRAYVHGTKENNAKYLNGIEFALSQKSYFSSDGIHPVANGQYSIALNLINALNTGYANEILSYKSITINFDTDYSGTFANFGGYLNNNSLDLDCQGRNTITCNDVELTCNTSDFLKIGAINTDFVIKGNYSNLIINVPAIIKNDGDYYDVQGILKIVDNDLYFGCLKINEEHSNYQTFSKIEQIQLSPFHASFISNTI